MAKPTSIPVAPMGTTQYVDISRIDSAWSEVVETRGQLESPIALDLRGAHYIDQESLLYICGLLSARTRAGRETFLQLPEVPRLQDFLYAWKFPETVQLSTKYPVERFLFDQQDKYFADRESRYRRYLNTPSGREALLPESFFAITPLSVGNDPVTEAEHWQRKWQDRQVQAILSSLLGADGERVASHIMYEMALNAVGHPNASVAFTSSQLLGRQRPSEVLSSIQNGAHHLQLIMTIWDDGRSILQTLEDALRETGRITSPAFGTSRKTFDLRVLDHRGEQYSSREVVESNDDGILLRGPIHLLLSAFFVGVTREPDRTSQFSIPTSKTDAKEHPLDTANFASGLGLYLLTRSVIETYGGSITYVSGHYRLEIRGSRERDVDYSARMTVLRSTDADIAGNLLITRLNLQQREDQN